MFKYLRSIDESTRKLISFTLLIMGFTVFLSGLYVDRVITFESLSTLSVDNVPKNIDNLKSKTPSLFTVISGSMEPAIKTASVVVSIPQTDYGKGDIISFRPRPNDKTYIVTHRILNKDIGADGKAIYTTSGDANDTVDKWEIKNDQIIGKVTLSIPYAGYITQFARQPKGFILLVIVPATIIIYEELKALVAESKKQIQKVFKKSTSSNTIKPLPKISVLLPMIGAILIVVSASVAFLYDREVSMNNEITVSQDFGNDAP